MSVSSSDAIQPGAMSIPRVSSPSPSDPVKPRLFALIIGINRYKVKEFSTLRGAEPDALAFKSYLENDLHVPTNQIKVLLNEQATRSDIFEAFEEMATNPLIVKEDPIVIFYAGHGTERTEAGVKTQMLVPHDFSSRPGEVVATITDRQIERLIGNIAAQKGDNITVIFDCCHSASGTRDIDANPSATIVRSIEIERSFDTGLYQEISRDMDAEEVAKKPNPPRRKATIDHYQPAGLQSHMLIAACGASEQAKEINGHGNFSVALLKLFKTYSPDKLRYCDILRQMDAIHGQNPQCEGKNQHRILFNAKVVAPARTFPVKIVPSPQESAPIIVEAGSAQGITVGAEFTLYSVGDLKFEEPLALATVKSVTAFTATLNVSSDFPHFDATQACVAIQTKAGQKEDVRLFVPPGDAFRAVFKSVRDDQGNSKYDLHNITLVADKTTAHLEATVNETDVLFKMTDERVTRYGFSRLFKAVDIHDSEGMAWTFGRIAHFYRELNRANSDPNLTSRIHIEFYELEETDSEDLDAIGKNLCNNGTIDLAVKEDIPYGMKLVNTSPHDLYPYLFWFDNTDLSINDCYLSPAHPNAPYTHDIPLPRRNGNVNGELTIGYGPNSGSQPFCFTLKDWQHLDVCFFKLFISTKPIDLSYIPQSSPFDINRGLKDYKRQKTDKWDSILIPVVQRREPLSKNRITTI